MNLINKIELMIQIHLTKAYEILINYLVSSYS